MNAIGSQLYKVPNGRSCVKWEAELDPLSVVEAAASVFDEETEFVPPRLFSRFTIRGCFPPLRFGPVDPTRT